MPDLRDRKRRHDAFFRRARAESYAARSVYKLEDLDRKFGLLRPGARVLDLGCRPGSWLQYAARRVGPAGRVVGLDRAPVTIGLPPGVRTLVGDVHGVAPAELLGDLAAFDVVLSDMAPDTTGVRVTDQARSEQLARRAFELACAVLAPGGRFLAKVFQGPDVPALVADLRAAFARVAEAKPPASRADSPERYLVGLSYLNDSRRFSGQKNLDGDGPGPV